MLTLAHLKSDIHILGYLFNEDNLLSLQQEMFHLPKQHFCLVVIVASLQMAVYLKAPNSEALFFIFFLFELTNISCK